MATRPSKHFATCACAALLLAPLAVWGSETVQPLQPASASPPSSPSSSPAAQPAPSTPPQAATSSSVIPDLVYKGVVGKALDVVPMDPENRRSLQRGNAVVSGTLAGRALGAALLGGTNPVFGIVGLAWGMYSAYNIKAGDPKAAAQASDTTTPAVAPRTVFEFPQAVSLARLAHVSVSDECN